MKSSIAGTALAAFCLGNASAGSAQRPPTICTELRAIVAAAKASPLYDSLRWRPYSPGLGFDHCSVVDSMMPDGGPSTFICGTDFVDSARRWERLNADILRCVPGAERFDDPDWTPPPPPDRHASFRAGRVRFDTIEAGYANRDKRYVAIHIEAQAEE